MLEQALEPSTARPGPPPSPAARSVGGVWASGEASAVLFGAIVSGAPAFHLGASPSPHSLGPRPLWPPLPTHRRLVRAAAFWLLVQRIWVVAEPQVCVCVC